MSVCTLSFKKKKKNREKQNSLLKKNTCFCNLSEWGRDRNLPTLKWGTKSLLSEVSYFSRDMIMELNQACPDYSLQIYQSDILFYLSRAGVSERMEKSLQL